MYEENSTIDELWLKILKSRVHVKISWRGSKMVPTASTIQAFIHSSSYIFKGIQMVRIKHRYLLVNILYPSGQAAQLKVANNDLPDVAQFHQPTLSEFNDEMLRRLIRNNVSELFGDYGIGMIASSLKGTLQVFLVCFIRPFAVCSTTRLLNISDTHRS